MYRNSQGYLSLIICTLTLMSTIIYEHRHLQDFTHSHIQMTHIIYTQKKLGHKTQLLICGIGLTVL